MLHHPTDTLVIALFLIVCVVNGAKVQKKSHIRKHMQDNYRKKDIFTNSYCPERHLLRQILTNRRKRMKSGNRQVRNRRQMLLLGQMTA